jgi:hypothetical protein
MSYYSGDQFFCGKCILKNRGWNIDQVTTPVAL